MADAENAGQAAPTPRGDEPPAGVPQEADSAAPAGDGVFSADRLQQMVAPVALYPDSLVTQILIAATYPMEVVEAENWAKEHSDLRGEALDKAVASQDWDESVRSLVRFPDVLAQMANNFDWTKDLGDAFLAQKDDVLNAVQTMRLSACDSGKLAATAEQNVIVEAAPPQARGRSTVVAQPQRIVRIIPVDPRVIHVPIYSPVVVFGPPPRLYYPIFNAYPPRYAPNTAVISFGIGLAVGAVLWSDTDWYHHRVYVNRRGRGYGDGYLGGGGGYSGSGRILWQHDAEHRRGASYRSPGIAHLYSSPGRSAQENGYREPRRRDDRGSNGNRSGSERGGGRGPAVHRAPAPHGPGAWSAPPKHSSGSPGGGGGGGRGSGSDKHGGRSDAGKHGGGDARKHDSHGGSHGGGKGR